MAHLTVNSMSDWHSPKFPASFTDTGTITGQRLILSRFQGGPQIEGVQDHIPPDPVIVMN